MVYSFLLRPHQGRALFPVVRHLCPYPASGHTGKQASDQEMGRRWSPCRETSPQIHPCYHGQFYKNGVKEVMINTIFCTILFTYQKLSINHCVRRKKVIWKISDDDFKSNARFYCYLPIAVWNFWRQGTNKSLACSRRSDSRAREKNSRKKTKTRGD